MHLLFPGRHHLLTTFQLDYLRGITRGDAELMDVAGAPLAGEPISSVVWAVTSANHWNTRRNPLPGHRREAAIEMFASELPVDSLVYLIDDLGETPRFAEYVLKKIEVASFGRLRLTPQNTLVACSTPAVIAMYERLGFRILPCELLDRDTVQLASETPWQLLQMLVATVLRGDDWLQDSQLAAKIADPSRKLYARYGFAEQIAELHRSTLLTDDGDLTETRDYNTYVRSFDEGAQRKYELIREHVQPGRIVDVGCCTGALLAEMTRDDRLRESDFYGVEVARQLYVECLHRKEQGAFANDHVFFYQRDFAAGPMFADHSVNTFTTFSLTHEIESYAGREALLHFIRLLRKQLASGGRWINVDVVGPEDGDREVYLWLNDQDGENAAPIPLPTADQSLNEQETDGRRRTLCNRLRRRSTHARFLQFVQDFRAAYGERVDYRWEQVESQMYAVLSLSDACEFMSKKDYPDNWQSEMHERFCFWSESQWRTAVEAEGLHIAAGSHSFSNPWIVQNRFRGKVALFERGPQGLLPLPDPVTNLILIAQQTRS